MSVPFFAGSFAINLPGQDSYVSSIHGAWAKGTADAGVVKLNYVQTLLHHFPFAGKQLFMSLSVSTHLASRGADNSVLVWTSFQ